MSGMSNHYLIRPFVKCIIPGMAEGVLYDLPYGYPAVTDGCGVVKGEIMVVRSIEKVLAVLDELEDYYGPGDERNLYVRVIREVKTGGGDKLPAYMYLWTEPGKLGSLGTFIKDGDWKKYKGGRGHN